MWLDVGDWLEVSDDAEEKFVGEVEEDDGAWGHWEIVVVVVEGVV